MPEDPESEQSRVRLEQRAATDAFVVSSRAALARLEALSGELNRARELDADVRALLPRGDTGETIREWLEGHDRIADEMQAAIEALAQALEDGTAHAATMEVYLQRLHAVKDPRDDA